MASAVDPERRIAAPGELELVRAFANTLRVEDDRDELATPADLKRWLRRNLGTSTRAQVGPAAHRRALRLRDALRALMALNSGERPETNLAAELNTLVSELEVGLTWTDAAEPRIESRASWPERALGRLLGVAAAAWAEGRWIRLKLCGNPDCRWAFYDHSRNRSARWCDMAVCGRRINQRRYRRRKGAAGRSLSNRAGA